MSNGTRIIAGASRSSEREWEQFYATVTADGSHGGGAFFGIFRNMVFEDPTWTLRDLDFDRDYPFAKRKLGGILDADSPALDAFALRGGKLIVYQGWADQQVPAEASIEYRDSVVKRSTEAQVDKYFRLFMVPGMLHCFLLTALARQSGSFLFCVENELEQRTELGVADTLVRPESAAQRADTAQLTTLGCEMGRAYARQDLTTLDKLNAEDYTQTDTRGIVVTRTNYLEYVRQRTADLIKNGVSSLSIDCDGIEVRLYGDAAVVTGGWTYTVQNPDGNVVRRSRWTSMWTRYPAGWKRHVFQNTWVNPDANQPTLNSSPSR